MDYGQELRFGLFPSPDAATLDRTLLLAETAEVSGLGLVSVQDHPYQARHVDSWTLLTAIAARSSTLRIALNVANLPLRPPVVLAKSIATLDLLTGGRVELGLGAGAFWDAIVAAGGQRLTPAQSVDALREGIEVIRGVWRGDGPAVRVEGDHHRIVGLHPGPAPAHPVEIWLGAYKPRMLRLTGRYADGWLPSMGYADRGITGSPEDWSEQLAELALDQGMSTFILGSDDLDDVRRFGEEVAPRVRDLVDEARRNQSRDAVTSERPPDNRSAAPGDPSAALLSGEAGGGASASRLDVHPTPDIGSRLSDQAAWDESTRPAFPAPATFRYTAAQQAAPQHLIDVHNGLRSELERLRDLVGQVEAGRLDVGAARSAINRMTLRQNAWTLGAYCEQYCRFVTTHHTLEDVSVFPHLRRVAGAGPVLDRLHEEHEVIADLLDHLDRALVDLVADEQRGTQALQDVLDLVTDALLSHLSYEERELLHPLSQAGFQ